jgi:hypothetical protein
MWTTRGPSLSWIASRIGRMAVADNCIRARMAQISRGIAGEGVEGIAIVQV